MSRLAVAVAALVAPAASAASAALAAPVALATRARRRTPDPAPAAQAAISCHPPALFARLARPPAGHHRPSLPDRTDPVGAPLSMPAFAAPVPAGAGAPVRPAPTPPRRTPTGPFPRDWPRPRPWLLAACLGLAGPTQAQAPATSPALAVPTPARGLDCMIQPSQVVQIGSPAPGVIERILVDRGDMVKAGQEIVHLNAAVERAALALARERAAQQGEVAATEGARELAERELARADELYQKKFVSATYRDKQKAEARVATGRSDEAQEKRKLAARELELATAQLAQRTLRAPVSGVVVERLMALGEYVDQKPVLRIAAIDPLRVDVLVPASAFGQVAIGMKGTVLPELVDRRALVGTVKTVDRLIDAASNTFRVRLELPNPGGALPAGLRCKVELGLNLPPEASRAAPPPPAAPAARPATAAGPHTASGSVSPPPPAKRP